MIKLICVTANNNNKFYNMEDLGNGNFRVEYGRVDGLSTILTYPMRDWDKKYNEKLKKGYIDITESLKQDITKNVLDINDPQVKELISFLMKCAKQSIKTNYNVDLSSISQIQIDKVQSLLDDISKTITFIDENGSVLNKDDINNKLKQIYTTIPRRMEDTRRFFLKDRNVGYLRELLQNEQQQLDTLKSQVNIQQPKTSNITLDTLGFTCEVASQKDRDFISKCTDFRLANHKVFKISNNETEKIFNPNNLKTKFLYHGSRNENFLSILQTGLKIRPAGVATTGSMFGNGIYAANKARKSIGYTSLRGSYWHQVQAIKLT